jgi:hypothetical protein
MRIFHYLVLSTCIFSVRLFAQQPAQPIKTTLCEIKKDPMAFNKKLVEVSGYATHGFEDSMFEDPACFEGSGRLGIWMEYGGTVATDTMYCCGVGPGNQKAPLTIQGVPVPLVQDDLFKRFDTMLHLRPRKDISIRAIVDARIFVAPRSVAQLTFGGYGHMGCCMLLAIEQVVSIESKKPEPSIFELAKKHQGQKP